MRARVTLTLTLSLMACIAPRADGDRARESELAVRSLIAAWERADTALIADLFWPQATYDDFPNQVTHQGLDEILAYVASAHAWGDAIYMNVGQVHAGPTGAVAEWVFSAVQARPLGATLPQATGREVVLNGVTIIEMEGGRILRAADYTDTAPMWLQLGGRIELPGGTVLRLDDAGN